MFADMDYFPYFCKARDECLWRCPAKKNYGMGRKEKRKKTLF